MKVFLLGLSGCGKTPLAQAISTALQIPFFSASDWVKPLKEQLPPNLTRAEYVPRITDLSVQALAQNRHRCVDHLRDRIQGHKHLIIEGIRNPHDFVHFYDYGDQAVFLKRLDWGEGGPIPRTLFENGLDVIQQYLSWLDTTGLRSSNKTLRFEYRRAELLGSVLTRLIETLRKDLHE